MRFNLIIIRSNRNIIYSNVRKKNGSAILTSNSKSLNRGTTIIVSHLPSTFFYEFLAFFSCWHPPLCTPILRCRIIIRRQNSQSVL